MEIQNDLSITRTLLILAKTNGLAGNCWRQRRLRDERLMENFAKISRVSQRLGSLLEKIAIKSRSRTQGKKKVFPMKRKKKLREEIYTYPSRIVIVCGNSLISRKYYENIKKRCSSVREKDGSAKVIKWFPRSADLNRIKWDLWQFRFAWENFLAKGRRNPCDLQMWILMFDYFLRQ